MFELTPAHEISEDVFYRETSYVDFDAFETSQPLDSAILLQFIFDNSALITKALEFGYPDEPLYRDHLVLENVKVLNTPHLYLSISRYGDAIYVKYGSEDSKYYKFPLGRTYE